MNQNIVIFGCDNSGKTTLAKDLNTLFSLEYGREFVFNVTSLGPNKKLKEQVEFMEKNIIHDGIKIFDRFPIIEEYVCGPVFRGVNNFKDYPIEAGSALLSSVDLFVFCYPGLSSVLNWGDREQMNGVKENILKLISGYERIAFDLISAGYNVVEYNYNLGTSEIFKIARRLL